jgi:hypothetical protein
MSNDPALIMAKSLEAAGLELEEAKVFYTIYGGLFKDGYGLRKMQNIITASAAVIRSGNSGGELPAPDKVIAKIGTGPKVTMETLEAFVQTNKAEKTMGSQNVHWAVAQHATTTATIGDTGNIIGAVITIEEVTHKAEGVSKIDALNKLYAIPEIASFIDSKYPGLELKIEEDFGTKGQILKQEIDQSGAKVKFGKPMLLKDASNDHAQYFTVSISYFKDDGSLKEDQGPKSLGKTKARYEAYNYFLKNMK